MKIECYCILFQPPTKKAKHIMKQRLKKKPTQYKFLQFFSSTIKFVNEHFYRFQILFSMIQLQHPLHERLGCE
jgi:hypothetical protein